MDPKTLASLDPKLRETYERVMGATSDNNVSSPPPPPTQTDSTTPTTPLPLSTNPTTPLPSNDQLSMTNPFATPTFEAVDTNPATTSNNQNPTTVLNPVTPTITESATQNADTSTLNPNGLSSAFPSPTSPDTNPFPSTIPQSENQPLPTVGSNTVDINAFNINPIGQKTDQIPLPEESPQPVNPVIPFTPEQPAQPISPTQSSFAAPVLNQAKPVSATIRILYIFAAVVFFMIYTFFWLKIFKFPLPF